MFRASFLKSFKKNIDAGLFSFLIVDAVHCKTSQYREFWSYAKQNGYEVREVTLLNVLSTLPRLTCCRFTCARWSATLC